MADADAVTVPAADAPTAPPASSSSTKHPRRWLVAGLLTLAVITGLIGIFSVFVNRQALNTDNWTNTSSQLLENNKVQTALSAYLVHTLFTNVDVASELKTVLPKQLQPLAGPAAAGLQQLAGQVAPRLLTLPQVQDAWRQANRAASKELLTIINGGTKVVSTSNGTVTLNVRTLVDQLAAQVGLSSQVNAARAQIQGALPQIAAAAQSKLGVTLPTNTGQIVIMRSNQLKQVQDIAGAIRHLAVWFTIIPLLLFALAIYLAHGWRRLVLRRTGWCFIGLGLVVLLARRVVENRVVDSLVANEANKPAAQQVWLIGTGLLRDIAVAMVAYGIIILIAAWIAGPTRPATALRRLTAFDLRERPGVAYGVLAGVMLLVLLWGPTPAFRNIWPVLFIILVAILGIEMLRRQTRQEFPNAHAGDASTEIKGWFGRGKAGKKAEPTATVVSEGVVQNGPEHAVAPVATPAAAPPADESAAATEVLEPTTPAE
jgi:hypothetical protein